LKDVIDARAIKTLSFGNVLWLYKVKNGHDGAEAVELEVALGLIELAVFYQQIERQQNQRKVSRFEV
jgi:hypothetical protein